MRVEVAERFKNYSKPHCWQYDIRLQNAKSDLHELALSPEEVSLLSTKDFSFSPVDKGDKSQCDEIRDFIERHEWLGKLPARPTHRFTARLSSTGDLAGVIIMATPNAFSHILGRDNKDKEKLISRGACISWAPKNLGSWLIMKSIRWMVKNSPYRIFTAYSDPEARELGTIYQACNFRYLGQTSGTNKQYFDPSNPKAGWFSDRDFRKRSKYKRYALEIGLSKEEWAGYMKKYSPNWEIIPDSIRTAIKERESAYRASCLVRDTKPKHKYAYILGSSKKETKKLNSLFEEHNPKKLNLPYPTPDTRGKA